MVGGAKTVSRHPMIALMGVTLFLTGTVMSFKRLDADINMQVFFDAGSEPVLAENFLEERLGGALFVQVEVTGDIKDPLVLRQMERLGDLAAAQEGVTGVQSVVVPMTLGARGLTGQARIPASSKSARAIAALLADADPAMGMLVDRKWAHALLQIKVSAKKTQAVLALVEVLKTQGTSLTGDRVAIPRAALTETQRHLEVEEVTAHVLNLAARHKKPPPVADQVRRVLNGDGALPPETAKAVITLLRRDIVTDEMLYLAPGADFEGFATRVAQLALAGQLTKKALYAQALKIVSDDEKKNPKGLKKAVGSLHTGITATTAAARTQQRITTLIGSHSGPYAEAIRRSISVLDDPYASLPASKTTTVGSRQVALSSKVSGYPVVYDTMNRSVYQNQTRSLILAAVLVLLTLVLFFRSLVVAVIALVPAALTLAVVFGIMGLAKIPMDVGTSMVASIALGVGIDYAVHLVWRAQGDAETDRWPAILGTTGWGIIINVLEVTAGFAILMLGTLVPMRHVGLLVAVAMIVAALTTLTLIPAALDWLRARRLRSSSCS